jgi:hypothetical protein
MRLRLQDTPLWRDVVKATPAEHIEQIRRCTTAAYVRVRRFPWFPALERAIGTDTVLWDVVLGSVYAAYSAAPREWEYEEGTAIVKEAMVAVSRSGLRSQYVSRDNVMREFNDFDARTGGPQGSWSTLLDGRTSDAHRADASMETIEAVAMDLYGNVLTRPQLEAVCLVAEHGSVAAAAEVSGIHYRALQSRMRKARAKLEA